jgi:hypothetical protein
LIFVVELFLKMYKRKNTLGFALKEGQSTLINPNFEYEKKSDKNLIFLRKMQLKTSSVI